MMGWYPGGWAGAGFWGMGVMVLVWGAVIAVAVWALARATRTEQVVGAPVESARALLDRRFAAGEIDLLVGTQMIAKGHDFPNVTLVGVISVDAGLGMPDFRAAERTFQLVTQVAGRAGRGEKAGRVLLQSYFPDHYARQYGADQDYNRFYQHEIRYREEMRYPPFAILINILIRHEELARAAATASELASRIKAADRERVLRILGPAAAPLARLKSEHRLQILIKTRHRRAAREALDSALTGLREAGGDPRLITIDMDPISLM